MNVKNAGWAFDSKKRRQEMIDKGFSIDNPAVLAGAQMLNTITNIPLDRLIQKVENMREVFAEDTEAWEAAFIVAGWPAWDVKKNKIKPKTKYTQDFLVSEFLHCEDKDNFDDIIKQEIIQVLKSFSWIIHNVADDYDFKLNYRDNFMGYNCDGSIFKLSLELDSGKLSYDFSLLIDKNDSFLTESMEISDKDTITLKGNGKSKKVKEFYLDSMDYKKHSVNYKRTELTNQY